MKYRTWPKKQEKKLIWKTRLTGQPAIIIIIFYDVSIQCAEMYITHFDFITETDRLTHIFVVVNKKDIR